MQGLIWLKEEFGFILLELQKQLFRRSPEDRPGGAI
jgi:hypothetical protein